MKYNVIIPTAIVAAVIGGLVYLNLKIKNMPSPYPKYTYGTKVEVTAGFYTGVVGYISSWEFCTDRDTHKSTVCYKLNADYGLFQVALDKAVNEKDLEVVEEESER